MSRIFEPFERLGAERGPVEGSGLGLALSRRLVEAMGGTLGVESTPSTGSTFRVLLERTTAPPGPRGEVAARESPSSASDTHEHPARTVLCVEDNLATVELIEEIFERRPGLCLMTAMRGEDAVRLAVEHRPALILLDMHLPDINGDLVLERLKSAAETRDIPVVIRRGEQAMSTARRLPSPFRRGDWVSFHYGPRRVLAQVIEDRGRLGVNRRRLYRVRLDQSGGEPVSFEIPEDDLEPVAAPEKPSVLRLQDSLQSPPRRYSAGLGIHDGTRWLVSRQHESGQRNFGESVLH